MSTNALLDVPCTWYSHCLCPSSSVLMLNFHKHAINSSRIVVGALIWRTSGKPLSLTMSSPCIQAVTGAFQLYLDAIVIVTVQPPISS